MSEFTPEAVAESFSPEMLDADSCRQWVATATRGENPVCPSCGILLTDQQCQRLLDGKQVDCRCGVSSSPRSGTILEGSTLSDRQLVFILALLHLGIPADQIANMAGCSRASVYNWRNRLGAKN